MGKIVVVGGGISGLTAAHALHAAGHEVLVLEQTRNAGGCIRSQRISGFLMEHGPNIMLGPDDATENLITELGLNHQRIGRGNCVRRRYLVRNGRLWALSISPLGFFTSNFFTLSARLRMLGEPFVSSYHDDESVAAFTRRRFGAEMLDYVIDPLVGGLYAGNPDRLSTEAVFPRLKRLEHETGSIIGGIIKTRRRRGKAGPDAPGNRQLFSFFNGLDTLPRVLAKRLGSRIIFGCRVEGITPVTGAFRITSRKGSEVRHLHADAVVLALPAYAAAGLVTPLDTLAGDILGGIPHPPLSVVFLGYRRQDIAHPLDGLGLLVPKIENRRILGILFSSTLFSNRAPTGHTALTVYIGGDRQPGLARLPAYEQIALAHEEASELLGISAAPIVTNIHTWRSSLPQPAVGHQEQLRYLQEFCARYPGLVLTGNYISGVSTTACIAQSRRTADQINNYLLRKESKKQREVA